jgi:hypothetical protein
LRHAGADLILGEREVALMDLNAVDAGEDRIGILRLDGGGREQESRERECAEREAGLRGVVEGLSDASDVRSGSRADTRRNLKPWQWQKASAMAESATRPACVE